MSITGRPLPTPQPELNPETAPFWEAADQGKLLLRRCLACQVVIWYPRSICPDCHSTDTEWFEASGRGVVYSCTTVRRGVGEFAEASPFNLSYIELAEGPRILSNVIDADPESIEIGQSVEVVFASTGNGTALPRFRPAASLSQGATDE